MSVITTKKKIDLYYSLKAEYNSIREELNRLKPKPQKLTEEDVKEMLPDLIYCLKKVSKGNINAYVQSGITLNTVLDVDNKAEALIEEMYHKCFIRTEEDIANMFMELNDAFNLAQKWYGLRYIAMSDYFDDKYKHLKR